MKQQKLFSERRINMEDELDRIHDDGWTVVSMTADGGVIVFLAEKEMPDSEASVEDKLFGINFRDLEPQVKLDIVNAMGFSRSGTDHTDDCPYRLDAGNRCNCVPPADVFTMPRDVALHTKQDWDSRLQKAKEPRPIPDVER